nr:MAG TPA: restriction alleviation protein [Caudoviricetes sp.]
MQKHLHHSRKITTIFKGTHGKNVACPFCLHGN